VTVWPAVSNLNLRAGEIRSNAVTVALGPSRTLKLYNTGTIDLVADLAGHYPRDGDSYYNNRVPRRVLDTRSGRGAIPAGGTIRLDFDTLPTAETKAVTVNITVVNPTANTLLTVWPGGSDRPNTSSVNTARGAITPNQVTVATSGASIVLHNHSGNAHVLVDDDPNSAEAYMNSALFNVTGTGGTAGDAEVPETSTVTPGPPPSPPRWRLPERRWVVPPPAR